ncbi:MAG: hypothetical protein IT423_19130, partial [Pirellulaceae bacterium]|nr:hypothetical protein [Pirellulaceae bacterium]
MPQRSWVCGYAELGKCCNAGPSHDGRCGRLRAAVDQQGNIDVSDTQSADGSTIVEDDQLPPCIPRRSHTWRRHTLRVNLAILTGGLLLLFMALPSRESTFVPGELSSKHAQILSNTLVSQRCGLCHPASHAEDPPARAGKLVLDAMAGAAGRLIRNDGRQDALCMKCHTSHMPMAAERNPHDLTPAMWRELETQNSTHAWQLVSARSGESQDALVDPSSNNSQESLGQTSCAMCHNEHHGRGFDLKLISDHRCQACHRKQFESLASGHPEFKNFPMDRPRGLAFSHARHADDHFPKK